jgi:hypothetical protein
MGATYVVDGGWQIDADSRWKSVEAFKNLDGDLADE